MNNSFFSFDDFAHAALWKEGDFPWTPLSRLTGYLKAKNLGQIEIEIPPGVYLDRPELISIGKGTVLEPGVYIQGPCIIGKNCQIRHGAYLRDSVILGDSCVVGHASEIKHSILMDGAHATHFVYVGDSILGNRVNLGAGVKCANLRLDRREIRVEFEGERIGTGLKKLGAIVGDDVQIGCNCVLNPGTLVGKESVSYPLVHFGGYVPPRCQVKNTGVEKIEAKILREILQRIGK